MHYSGGEPTLRRGLPEIIEFAKGLGFEEQVITTNGILLERNFKEYVKSGLDRANISIDSLDRNFFKHLTKRDELNLVMSCIFKSLHHYGKTKINVVVLKDNIHEIKKFIELSEMFQGKIICRFIELQSNQPVFYNNGGRISDQHVTLDEIKNEIRKIGELVPNDKIEGENPNCSYFKVDGTDAVIGIIANHSRGYPCGGCHKIRISPYGIMGVCINADGINIKNATKDELRKAFDLSIHRRDLLDNVFPNRKHHSSTYGFWRWGDVSVDKTGKQAEVNIKNLK